MKRFVRPIMDLIKYKKPYYRTRLSKRDDYHLQKEIDPMAATNQPNDEPRQPLADDDPGFFKKTVLNPKTNRRNQIFECKYCGVTNTKIFNIKAHINMHKGLFPYHCNSCTKVFSQLANRNRHQKDCNKNSLRSRRLFQCEKKTPKM